MASSRSFLVIASLLIFANAVPEVMYLPLKGDLETIFMFYTTVQVGTPSVPFTVVVDTGSADFLIPDISCQSCYGGDPTKWYNSTLSETSSPISCNNKTFHCSGCTSQGQCEYAMHYVGIEEDAYVYSDVVTVQDQSVNLQFGSIYNVSMGETPQVALFRKKQHILNQIVSRSLTQDDNFPEGMWGLGYPALNSLGAVPLFDALVNTENTKNVFSMCINPVGGMLVLGDIGPYHTGQFQWAAMNQNYFYGVTFLDVLVNDQSINVPLSVFNPKTSIVDSGTVMPTLPTRAFDALRQVVENNCSNSNLYGVCTGVTAPNATLFDQICFNMTDEQILQFPTIQFVLKGIESNPVRLSYPPTQYLRYQYYCNPGMVGLGLDQDPDFTILGAELMLGFNTVFDREHNRVGFAPVMNCPSE